MPDSAIKPAIRTALRLHEIGDATPYKLFFAGKGKSGGSFGFMQGDLAAGQPVVKAAFAEVMTKAGVDPAKWQAIQGSLCAHCIENPLGSADTGLVNGALSSAGGRPVVDAMDEKILGGVYEGLDKCLAAATAGHRTIDTKAMLYLAMWINMTGPPSTVANWLAGHPVTLARPVDPAPAVVDGSAMEAYLRATSYYSENPGNIPHAMQCAAAGMAALR
jgi:hypothetical protein